MIPRPSRKDITLAPDDLLRLDPGPRLLMLLQLRGVLADGPITVADWREAYGRAADYQTVSNARVVLEQDEVAA